MKTLPKLFLLSAGLCTTIFIIISCGANQKLNNATAKSNNKVKVTQPVCIKPLNIINNSNLTKNQETVLKNAIRKFEFENQELILNLTNQLNRYDNSLNNSKEQFIVNTITNLNPEWDIVSIDSDFSNIAELLDDAEWAKKNLVDFSQIPEFRASVKPEILSENFKKNWGGIVPGPALQGNFYCIYYNKELANKIGISVKEQNMTFRDLKSYLSAIKKFNENNPNQAILPLIESEQNGSRSILATQLFASLFNNADDFLSETHTETKLNEWQKVLNALEELSLLNIFNETLNKSISIYDDNYMFIITSSSEFNNLHTLGESYFPAQLPGFKQSNLYPIHYSVSWAVPKNAPNKQEAINFLLKLNTPEFAEEWVKSSKCPTGIKCNNQKMNFMNNSSQEFTSYINNRFSSGKYKIKNDNALLFGNHFKNIRSLDYEVITGNISAEEAAKIIRDEIKHYSNLLTINE